MQRLDDVRRYEVDSLNYSAEEKFFDGDRLSGELELKNVKFGYSSSDAPLIQDFSLHLNPGHWVAIVGASGSGKSTVSKIVTGLYEAWEGEILFDGVPRRKIPRAVIVNSFSSVDQDIFQISGTVSENIALFDKTIKRVEIIKSAQDACIHDDILKLKGGYDSLVSEGGRNFSVGQRQIRDCGEIIVLEKKKMLSVELTKK